jgi:hypothetical protein
MHIRKNVTKTLWRLLDGRSDKQKIVNIFNDIKEANHAMQSVIHSNSNAGDQNISTLPWLLIEKQRKDVKEVIKKYNFPLDFLQT